jgi:hypothetical protein
MRQFRVIGVIGLFLILGKILWAAVTESPPANVPSSFSLMSPALQATEGAAIAQGMGAIFTSCAGIQNLGNQAGNLGMSALQGFNSSRQPIGSANNPLNNNPLMNNVGMGLGMNAPVCPMGAVASINTVCPGSSVPPGNLQQIDCSSFASPVGSQIVAQQRLQLQDSYCNAQCENLKR